MTRIPLVDLGWQHRQVADAIESGWREVVDGSAYVQGPVTAAFEAEFAAFCGVRYCVGVANGTDALELSLRSAGIGPGDRVVVPANTFVATAEAVVRAGASPVFVDCDAEDHLIDVDQARVAMADAQAVIPVHLYGQVAPMERLMQAAEAAGCLVIEDAAQAQGATRHGRGIGGWGLLTATSFYPGKNLGAYGDAGAVLTNDEERADTVRRLANHGVGSKNTARSLGFNSRLDSMQAVVLRAKLVELDRWNRLRREAADCYRDLLRDDVRVKLPTVQPGNLHVWHLYVVEVPARDVVLGQLRAVGIEAAIHYPVPVHLEAPFSTSHPDEQRLPVAESSASRLLSLPVYPGITTEQQVRVVTELRRALDSAVPE